MRRSGNICDTLVFLLVAFLLPAWILGHLYLMFFPASDVAAQSGSDGSGLMSSLTGDGSSGENSAADGESEDGSSDKSDGMIGLLDEKPDSATPPASHFGQQKVQWEQEQGKFEMQISDLQSENKTLTQRATELANQKSAQMNEITSLKNRLKQAGNGGENLATMSTQLRDAQTDYAQLNEKFGMVQNENSELVSTVSDLELKLQNVSGRLEESDSKLAEQMRMRKAGSGDGAASEALVAASEKLLGEANAEKRRLQGRVTELTGALETAQSSLATQKQELTNTTNRLEQLNAKYAMTLKRLAADETGQGGQSDNLVGGQSNRIETSRRPDNDTAKRSEKYREFVSSRGNRSTLAFVQWVGNEQVVVRSFANKQLYQVPIERFSEADQKYLRDQRPDGAR